MFILKKTYSLFLTTLIILGSFFFSGNIENFVSRNVSSSISITHTHAATVVDENANATTGIGKAATQNESQDVRETMNKLIGFLNVIGAILATIISPLILTVGWLMSPDWTTGDMLGMQKVIYNLWIVVCNIIYVVYAILLIIVALATIFNNQNYHYKKLLPRLLIGILMVPATWWIVQVTISLSTTATAVVLSIPMETMNKITANNPSWWTDNNIPKTIDIDTKTWQSDTEKNKKTLSQLCQDKTQCVSPQAMLSNASGIYGNLLIYAYGVFRIQEINVVKTNGLDVIKDFAGIVNSSLVGLLMYIVFGLLTIGLLLVLIFRVFWLFVYTIFSPIFTLSFVLGKESLLDEKFSVKEFIATAFIPAIVGLVLSMGLILVSAVHTGFDTKTNDSYQVQNNSDGSASKTLFRIMGNPNNEIIQETYPLDAKESNGKKEFGSRIVVKIGGVQIRFPGSSKGSDGSLSEDSGSSRSIRSLFGELIIQFIAIAFLWLAFTSALSIAKIAKAVARPFEGITTAMKTGASTLVKGVPIPFVGNLGGVEKTLEAMNSTMTTKVDNVFKESTIGQTVQKAQEESTNTQGTGTNSIKDEKIRKNVETINENLKKLESAPTDSNVTNTINTNIKTIVNNSDATDTKAALENFFKGLYTTYKKTSLKEDRETMLTNLKFTDEGKKLMEKSRDLSESQFVNKIQTMPINELKKLLKLDL